jgi:hypothetical protein
MVARLVRKAFSLIASLFIEVFFLRIAASRLYGFVIS